MVHAVDVVSSSIDSDRLHSANRPAYDACDAYRARALLYLAAFHVVW